MLNSLYWNIGKKINDHILGNQRAEYGKQILATLSQELTETYGRGWNEKTLRHSLRSAERIELDPHKNDHVPERRTATRVLP